MQTVSRPVGEAHSLFDGGLFDLHESVNIP